jgi:hypothetical protein
MRNVASAVLCILTFSTAELRADAPLCKLQNCEYLVRSGVGSYPPNGPERGRWECHDQKTGISLNCSFVRGDDIKGYADVYRKEEPKREMKILEITPPTNDRTRDAR